jgi:hypothetical protein
MCAFAGYIYSSISATIKSYLKAFATGIMRSIYCGSWSPRWCASPASSLHDVARRAGALGGYGCFDTLRWVSRLQPVMTIQFLPLTRPVCDVVS